MKKLAFILLALISFNSFATTTICNSYDNRLNYRLETADGGAAVDPTETLQLDNETLISIIPAYDYNTILASTTFSQQPVWESEPVLHDDFYTTTTQVKHLLVKLLADDSKVFEDYILCKYTTYNGPPLP